MRLSVGDKVDVTVDALPSSSYAGRIQQVGPIAAATGQYFPVVVSLKNDGRLLAGMTAKASFITTGAPGIIIPLNAVAGNEDGHADVFVMTAGTAHKRQVALGPRNDKEVQVLSGLSAGDSVAVSNVSALLDGMEVAQ